VLDYEYMDGFFPADPRLQATAIDDDVVALNYAGHRFSYGELYRETARLARGLSVQGVQAGDVVGVLASSPMLCAWMVYVSSWSGLTLIPLDPAMGPERRNRLLAQAGCHLVISEVEPEALPQGVRCVPAASLFQASPAADEAGAKAVGWADGDIALIIATSGTEGDSKGVILSRGNLVASARAVQTRLALGPGDLWLCCLPLHHIGGLSILYRSLGAGAGVLLHGGFDARQLWSDLHAHQVTHISLVPAMLERLLEVAGDRPPPTSLGMVLVGGGPMGAGLAARAHARGWPLCISYGMSESASLCACLCGTAAGMNPGVAGLPLDGFELAISERGRVMLRGPAVMQGYANPEGAPGIGLLQDGWFESGDLGSLDRDGRLRVTGRADDMLVSGGRNIHPAEVEALVAACPGVGAVAVTGQPDESWGQVLVALYIGIVSTGVVRQWCGEHLPSALRPRRFVRVGALPHDAMGKLDRKALRRQVNQG
jgi:o-succinylbenzoate---CoA ligase